MQRNLFLLLSLLALMATGSFAQSNTSQNQSGPNVSVRADDLAAGLARYLANDSTEDLATGLTRPRVVEVKASAVKASGVKASVVVNIVAVERVAFEMINQKRIENGLRPLAWNAELASVARVHSQNMAEYQFFGHRGLDGKMVSDRADHIGLSKWRAIGENIAFNRGYQDPIAKAVEGWMNSPGHRHNLLEDSWKESAVGAAVAPDGSYYFTQVFLLKK